jgi:hypothetical protein
MGSGSISSGDTFGNEMVDRCKPAVADRVPLEEGLVLGLRKLDESTVRQQPCGAAMRFGAQKGLDPGAGEQDRGVNPTEKFLLSHPRSEAECGVEPAPGRLVVAQRGTCQKPAVLQPAAVRIGRGAAALRRRDALRPPLAGSRDKAKAQTADAGRTGDAARTVGGRPAVRIASIGAARIAASNRPG